MIRNEIKRQYNKLLKDVATNDYYKGDLSNRVNCYVCKCGHITKTKDVDSGVTPFMFGCEQCGDIAQSTMFRDVAPNLTPSIEWYRPSLEEVFKMKPSMVDHILRGGLAHRPVSGSK